MVAEYLPGTHFVQFDAPVFEVNCPAAHGAHFLASGLEEYLPKSHEVQVEAPAAE